MRAVLLITAVVIICALGVMSIAAYAKSKKTYTCEQCGAEINEKWYRLIFAMHYDDGLWLKCPNCGSKELKTPKE